MHGVIGEGKLHYTRGKVYFNRQIEFETEHPRLESEGSRSNVVLLNNSSILQINRRSKGIVYRTGALSAERGVTWSQPQFIDGTKAYRCPAVAANATNAIVTFESEGEGVFSSIYLRYSPRRYPM